MAKEKKSYDLDLPLSAALPREAALALVERAAAETGLYISHIGGYSRVKYPNSVHWHFKRDKKEPGLIDATYWLEGVKFWLVIRNSEPAWVHETAPLLQKALAVEISRLPAGSN